MMYINDENRGVFRLVHDIYAVQDDDIACDEAAIQMDRSTEELLSDEQSRLQFPLLWRHFRLCQDCMEEYQMLIEIARLEAAGGLKKPDKIPPRPREVQPLFDWSHLKDAITALFSGFTMPLQPAAVLRNTALTFEPVELELDDGNLIMTFDLVSNSTDSQLWDLHCWVESEEEAVEEMFEFAPVWLQRGAEGPVVQEQALNELGDVIFSFLSPDHYTFGLYLAGQEYIVHNLVLPERLALTP